jgi:hypothetical protein
VMVIIIPCVVGATPLSSANWIERNDSAIDYWVSCDKLSPPDTAYTLSRQD